MVDAKYPVGSTFTDGSTVQTDDIVTRADGSTVETGTTTTVGFVIYSRAPTPQQTAQDNLQQLAATASAQLTQAQADAAMFAATPVGSTLTADHIAALGRFADGFQSLIGAIQNHCVFTGAIPPGDG